MPGFFETLAGLGGSLASAGANIYAADRAADAAQVSADNANRLQRDIYRQNRKDYTPYRVAGYAGLNELTRMLGLGDEGYQEDELTNALRATPGYQFQMDEGQKAIERSAAAQGGVLSGRTMKDLRRFSQGLADQTYNTRLNQLAGLSGTGQTATGSTAAAGQNYASQAGQNMMAAGDARGSSYLTAGDQVGRAFNNLAYMYG